MMKYLLILIVAFGFIGCGNSDKLPEAIAYLTEKERIGKITESLNKMRSQLATCTI